MTCSNCKTKQATAVKKVKNVYYVLCDDCEAELYLLNTTTQDDDGVDE